MEVAVGFFFVANEKSADGEGLKFERGDASVRRKRRRRGLGREPGDGGGARGEIHAGGVGVGESFDGPTFRPAVHAAADWVHWQAEMYALAIEVESQDQRRDDDSE